MNTVEELLGEHMFSLILDKYLGLKFLGARVNVNFTKNCPKFAKVAALSAHQPYMRVAAAACSCQYWILSVFSILSFSLGVRCSMLVLLICIADDC